MNRLRIWRPSQWEVILVLLTICAGAWSASLSPYYLSVDQIAESTQQFIFPGLLALGLAIVVILGEIDISVASTLAVGSVLFSKFSAGHVDLAVAIPTVVIVCALLGSLNGFLVATLRLPSLAVTLGTMGAYRGLAFIIGSERGYTDFDDSYVWVGSQRVLGDIVPVSFILFVVASLVVGFVMHNTVFGRRCFAVGHNQDAAWFSGIKVRTLKIQAFTIAGALAGFAALVWIGQYGSARGDNADGSILLVVTAVVLGGVDINGGKGSILGVVLALFLLGTIRNGMGLANIPGPTQTVVLGLLLVAGVLHPVLSAGIPNIRRLLQKRAIDKAPVHGPEQP